MDARMAEMGYPVLRTLAETPNDRLSLEKDWQMLHFALTKEEWGGVWPANFLMGGQSIGGDMGYGPGKILTAQNVKDVAGHLEPLTARSLLDNIADDELAAAEIYPFHEGVPPDEFEECVLVSFDVLKTFVQKVAAADCSVFVFLS